MGNGARREKSLKRSGLLFVVIFTTLYFLLTLTATYFFIMRGVGEGVERLEEERIERIEADLRADISEHSQEMVESWNKVSSVLENMSRQISLLSELGPPLLPYFEPYIFVPPDGKEEAIWSLPVHILNISSYIQNSFKLLRSYPEVLNVYYTFSDGVTVFPDHSTLEAVRKYAPLNPATRPWYVGAVEEGATALSDVYRDLITGNYLITLSCPLYNSSGLMGVMGADLNITGLIQKMNRIDTPGLEVIFLLDTRGNVLASTDPAISTTAPYSIEPIARSRGLYDAYMAVLRSNSSGTFRTDNRCLIWEKIKNTDLIMVGELNTSEAIAPFTKQADAVREGIVNYIVASLFVIAIFLLLVNVVFPYSFRRMFRTIGDLRRAAEEIGRGRYGVKIDPPPYKEIKPLAEAFNRMSEQLKRDRERMRKSHLEVERAKKAGDLFLEIAAHDVKNLLTGIRLNAEYLKMKRSTGEEIPPDVIEKILAITDSATDTLDKIRDLYRIKMFRGKMGKVDLKELIHMAEELIYRTNPSRIIEIEHRLPEGSMMAPGDTFLLNLFLNLFQNAVKYTEGDVVKIDVKANVVKEGGKPFWRITVADHGRGIPPQRKKDVFKRFSTWDSVSGSGLGLAIVRELVERVGGRIYVEDRVPGDHTKGTRFVILLPFYKGEESVEEGGEGRGG